MKQFEIAQNILVDKFFLILLFVMILPFHNYAQDETGITKSEIIESINGKDYYLHFVKQGQTLFEIAKTYDISVDDLFANNPDARNGIKAGQVLKIPVSGKEKKAPLNEQKREDYFFHIVKSKETLYGIALKYGVTIEDIKRLNPELGEYPKEGETLKIPTTKKGKPEPGAKWEGETVKHTVSGGETLYGIAKKYNVTTGEIINANPGMNEQLKVGQVILIPNQQGINEVNGEPQIKPEKFIEHTVLPGETIYTLAVKLDFSIDSLKKYNPLLIEPVRPGQVVKVPEDKKETPFIIHKADKKERVEEIAAKYKVNYYKILVLNPGISKKAEAGQLIKIPVEITKHEESDTVTGHETIPGVVVLPCEDIVVNKEKTYNVALMLPFYLDEVDSLEQMPEPDLSAISDLSAFRFIQFYEGFLMAVDSMKNQGMKLNLFVYDVDNSEQKIQKVLHASELSSMDLIIGPLFNDSFKKIAAFAKTCKINIVNPLSPREEIILNNPFVFKVKPEVSKQSDQLINYLLDHYPKSNIVIIRQNKYQNQASVSYIRNYLNSRRASRIYLSNRKLLEHINLKKEHGKIFTENMLFDTEELVRNPNDSSYLGNTVKEVIYDQDSLLGLKMNLSKLRNNVVIAFSEDNVFSQEILSKLNKLRENYDITLFGLPNWNKFDNLETQQMLNLDFHSLTSSIINFNDKRVINWIEQFREKYKTEPSTAKYAFDGFDIGWYFLNALFLHGKDFQQCISEIEIPLIQTKYKFEEKNDNGFQNTHWDIGEYKDYTFNRVTP